MHHFLRIFFILAGIIHFSIVHSDDKKLDEVGIDALNQNYTFVSLGSHCEVATMIHYAGYRKAAFPFDWLLTLDGEKLIELLEDDAKYFLDENYLLVDSDAASQNYLRLQNWYYHIDFLHEGFWEGDTYYSILNWESIRNKYIKRFARFKALNDFPGRVYFIRSAYFSAMNPYCRFPNEQILEITSEHAERLYCTLKRVFPNLDFKLVIANLHDRQEILVENSLGSTIIYMRSNPGNPPYTLIDEYQKFLRSCLVYDGLE